MKKNRKIGIIGHFGGEKVFYDGQTVKTKNLKMLVEEYGGFETFCVDTYLNKTNKVKLLFKSLSCLFKCKKIFILLSENESEDKRMSISREQALMIERLKENGTSDATIGAMMVLLSSDAKIAALAEEIEKKPSADEDELFMLAIRIGHAD